MIFFYDTRSLSEDATDWRLSLLWLRELEILSLVLCSGVSLQNRYGRGVPNFPFWTVHWEKKPPKNVPTAIQVLKISIPTLTPGAYPNIKVIIWDKVRQPTIFFMATGKVGR